MGQRCRVRRAPVGATEILTEHRASSVAHVRGFGILPPVHPGLAALALRYAMFRHPFQGLALPFFALPECFRFCLAWVFPGGGTPRLISQKTSDFSKPECTGK